MSHDVLYCNMSFDQCIKILHHLLKEQKPKAFDGSWVRTHNLAIYNFVRTNIRTEIGDIDWDRVTAALPRKFQKLWSFHSRGKRPEFGPEVHH